jgi:hypothetical protein
VEVAVGGAYAADGAAPVGEHGRDLLAESDVGPCGAQELGGGHGGLDLGVLRVVEGSGEAGREVGFEVAEAVGGDLVRLDARLRLAFGEGAQCGQGGPVGCDDETALALVLGLRWECSGQLAPQSGGQQREVGPRSTTVTVRPARLA